MPRVTMPKDHPSAALIVNDQRVERGKSVEVDDDTAASLAEQGWTVAKKAAPASKAKKATDPDASTDADPKES